MDFMKTVRLGVLLLVFGTRGQHCLDNGVARSPPMGWITTERFECNVDCVNYPDDCISEKLVKTTADVMVQNGYREAGYSYLILGDCWMNKTRDGSGDLIADSKRFPGGIKALAEYVHQKGLRLGVLIDLGNSTCNGYPGSHGNYPRDAATLAGWGVDYVKATACYVDRDQINSVYPSMGSSLNKTGRPMVYACDWPLDLQNKGMKIDYRKISNVCNIYTSYKAMVDSWESLEDTIKNFGKKGRDLVNFTGPGSWSIPNPLLVGDFGLSHNEEKMQLAVWSLMAAPLLVSADLRHVRDDQRALLLHKDTLSIDQDMLYQMGIEYRVSGQVHIWRKPLKAKGSYALAFMYFNISGGPSKVTITIRDIGLVGAAAYNFTNIYTQQHMGLYKPWYTFNCEVDPVGTLFIRADALP